MNCRLRHLRAVFSAGCALLLALLGAACDSSGSTSHAASSRVGRSGGILSVEAGPLAGTTLVIPVFALEEVVTITIDEGNVQHQPDAMAIGPATTFGPSELEFAIDASAILVFRSDEVPEGTPISEFVVKRADARGRITDLVPNLVKPQDGTLLVLLPEFSSYWVAIKEDPFTLADYWPMQDGDTYEYNNGVVLHLLDTSAEPQINQPVIKATFLTATGDLGLYLDRVPTGETYFRGRFSVSEGFQELETRPLLFLPDQANLGDSGQSESDLVGFEPFGSIIPTFTAHELLTTTLVTAGTLNTPLGQFPDVIEIEILSEREDTTSGGKITSSTVRDRLWLARGVGPVHIQLQGMPLGQVTGGVVGGQPLTGN